MTVKCLTREQKQIIAYQFKFIQLNVNDIADEWQRSVRTIHRVLEEEGVAPARRKRIAKAKTVMPVPAVQVPPELHELPKLTAFENFKCFLKAVFNKKSIKANVPAQQ